ncbi:MAG: hypothetical protein ACREQR_10575 [Candidatus Binataceae bacterium]
MRRLAKFAGERALVLRAWTELVVMRIATWAMPYVRVRAIVAWRGEAGTVAAAQPERDRIAWAITVASG